MPCLYARHVYIFLEICHPNHRMKVPKIWSSGDCCTIGCGTPSCLKRPMRGPVTIIPVNAETPPTMCTITQPAKSVAAHMSIHMSVHMHVQMSVHMHALRLIGHPLYRYGRLYAHLLLYSLGSIHAHVSTHLHTANIEEQFVRHAIGCCVEER